MKFNPHVNQHLRRKQPISHIKRTTRTHFCLASLFWVLGFPINIFVNGYTEIPLISHCVVYYPLTKGKIIFVRVFLVQHPFMTNPTIFWTLLGSNEYESVQHFVIFLSGKKYRYRLSTHMLIFVVNIRPAWTLWNSTSDDFCPIFIGNPIFWIQETDISNGVLILCQIAFSSLSFPFFVRLKLF